MNTTPLDRSLKLRDCYLGSESPRLVELLQANQAPRIRVEAIREISRDSALLVTRRLVVAVAWNSQILGFVDVGHHGWKERDTYWLKVVVDPLWLGYGVGTRLYYHAFNWAVQRKATHIITELNATCKHCLQFARNKQFNVLSRFYELSLDLRSPRLDTLATTRIQDIAPRDVGFVDLMELGDTPEARQGLFSLNRRLVLEGAPMAGFPDYQRFCAQVFHANWYRPSGQVIAVIDEEWVGLCAVGCYAAQSAAYNGYTGVDQRYRNRGIGTALKLLAIRRAKAWGADSIWTNIGVENEPMWHINRKWGYKVESEYLRLRQEVVSP